MNNGIADFRLNYHNDLCFFYNTHVEYEIVWVTEGCLIACVNGNDIPLNKGQTIFLPPYFTHAFRTDDNSKCYILEFSSALVPEKLPNDIVLFHIPDDTDKIIHKEQNEGDIFMKKALVYRLLSNMLSDKTEVRTLTVNDICLDAVRFIVDNYSQSITLHDVADSLSVNYSYLSRIFKECMGFSFTDCLNGTRLNSANGMLSSTSKTITEIALDCGFGSVRNFNRIFIDKFKCSPSEFRKMHSSTKK